MAQQFAQLSVRGRAYVLGVSAAGLSIAAHSLAQLYVEQVSFQWVVLAALTLLTGTFTVRIPGVTARLSVSDTFVFASILLFGPAAGTITSLLDALIISLRLGHHQREPFRVIFNLAVGALSTWVAGQVFFGVAGVPPYSVQQTPLGQVLFPLFLLTLSFFLLNSWLVAFALALEGGKSPFQIWRDNFLWLSVNYFGGASVAGLLVSFTREIDFTTLGIIVPLLLISYLTFKTSLGRIEDANLHLSEVNKMYLSTIETLAMAIDAKDQVTHGHIRRVQRYAVGLARAVGVNDDTQIKAIEAAALLHDMGKLAIPEFILNKPGRLTGNEFDVMKQHANIGADILSSIHFPYPVVPIVRHHHECWNGSGYPYGLKGVAIPLGARILSVVDCFDALTSDRPYRPRLPVSEAIAILLQRRGSMYDPLVVDKFIEAQPQLSTVAESDEPEKEALDSLATKLRIVPEPPAAPLADVNERLPLKFLSLLQTIAPSAPGTSVEDLGIIVSRQVRRITSASAIAIYGVGNENSLQCLFADGALSALVNGPDIVLGERLSGWVAAHRTPIWNSDATLDLSADVAKAAGVSLGSSVPLIDGEILVGALTFYAAAGSEIPVEHRVLIQAVAPLLAATLSTSLAHDQVASIDGTTKPSRETLYSVLDTLLSHRIPRPNSDHSEDISIVLVTIDSFNTNLEARFASTAAGVGTVIRLSSNELLLIAPQKATAALRLESAAVSRSANKPNEFKVSEIANSLQLREVLGLTQTTESPSSSKPLVH